MSFCEHCQGQRFDRARVLRVLRQLRRELRAAGPRRGESDHVFERVLDTLRQLEIPHVEVEEDTTEVVH